MNSRRNVVAAFAVLALLVAGPAHAGWTEPGGNCNPAEMGLDDMMLAAHMGLQIAQAAL